jgi:hypothetical protein
MPSQNKLLVEVKMTSKEKGTLKSIGPFKTLGLFNILKVLPLFQNDLRKDTSKPFVCVLQRLKKSGFLQIGFSEKNGFRFKKKIVFKVVF